MIWKISQVPILSTAIVLDWILIGTKEGEKIA